GIASSLTPSSSGFVTWRARRQLGGAARRPGSFASKSTTRRLRAPLPGSGRRRRSRLYSSLSLGSAFSFLSVGSLLSVGSILSIGSAGSILSIGSAGSILSIGSAGSILSIGGAGARLGIGARRRLGLAPQDRNCGSGKLPYLRL